MKHWFARSSTHGPDPESLLRGAGAACACAYDDWNSFSRETVAVRRRPTGWRAILAWSRIARPA
jgi:hypothetical protein